MSAWITCWLWVPINALLAFVALLFPDGKLPSTRWRAIGWLNGVMAVAGSVAAAFLPGPTPWIVAIDNPFGVEALKDIKNLVDGSLEALSYGVLGVAAVVSLYVRFRGVGQVEREQIKCSPTLGRYCSPARSCCTSGPTPLARRGSGR